MLKKCITTAIDSDNLRILHLLHHLSDKVGSLRAILESVMKKKLMFHKIFVSSARFNITCFNNMAQYYSNHWMHTDLLQ